MARPLPALARPTRPQESHGKKNQPGEALTFDSGTSDPRTKHSQLRIRPRLLVVCLHAQVILLRRRLSSTCNKKGAEAIDVSRYTLAFLTRFGAKASRVVTTAKVRPPAPDLAHKAMVPAA